jgi:hypothetical protein
VLSKAVAPVLRDRGYKGSGSTFHRRAAAGWGAVRFQKSSFGSRVETRFAVNLGVALDRLTAADGGDPTRKPSAYGAQWGCRLNDAGDGGDHWWTINAETDLDKLSAEFVPILVDVGLHLIDERLTDAGMLRALRATKRIGQVKHERDALALLAGSGRQPPR